LDLPFSFTYRRFQTFQPVGYSLSLNSSVFSLFFRVVLFRNPIISLLHKEIRRKRTKN
jgi:hypothetical protein